MDNKDIKQYIDSIIWHIETNRETQNDDSRMLSDVYSGLKNVQKWLTKDG